MVTKGWSFVGASMVEEEEENGNVRERKELSEIFFWLSEDREQLLVKKKGFSLFLLFYLSYATCLHLSGAKRAHFLF